VPRGAAIDPLICGIIGGPVAELLSIVVPAYNEGATILAVLDRLLTIELPCAREIIVVNDASTDGTRAALDAFAAAQPLHTVIHVAENRGKGHAVRLGLARSRGSVTAIQDADLELDPAQLAALVAPVLSGAEVAVYGSRFLGATGHVPLMTRLGNLALTWVTNRLYGQRLTDMETCYKIIRGDVARALPLRANRFDIEPEITALLLRSGHRIVEQPVAFAPRSKAAGKKIRWRDGVHAIQVLVKYRFTSQAQLRRDAGDGLRPKADFDFEN
jgi:glycosyltransferase involved in cell wall biosynthesis